MHNLRRGFEDDRNLHIQSMIRFIIIRHRHTTMSLRAIIDKADIKKYSKKLEEQLRNSGKHIGDLDTGRRHKAFVKYQFPQEGIWWQYKEESKNERTEYRNWFGLDEPSSSKPREVCQINFYAPPDFKHQSSAFAEDDETGKAYMIHSGYLCWSNQKEGRILFKGSFEETKQLVQAEWGNELRDAICVSSLDDVSLIHNLANFVKEVDKTAEKVSAIRDAEMKRTLPSVEETIRSKSESELKDLLANASSNTNEYYEWYGKRYKRDALCTETIKRLRGHQCQLCGEYIMKRDRKKYVEAAHIKAKKDGGVEKPYNIMILCPNHHKEFDLGDVKIIQSEEKRMREERMKFVMNGTEYNVELSI